MILVYFGVIYFIGFCITYVFIVPRTGSQDEAIAVFWPLILIFALFIMPFIGLIKALNWLKRCVNKEYSRWESKS
jgi:hypothetical protein